MCVVHSDPLHPQCYPLYRRDSGPLPSLLTADYRQLNDSSVDTHRVATLLVFLVELLKSSVAMQEQMLGGKGFLVIGYLLEKSSRVHITRAVLDQSVCHRMND
ncbi:neurobeachin-like [Salvelinus sp. IW2-2015]|uniref:neurobeachin-like n=1 Tax=Salvelinus sp. IW2-2015 TaxID=2691554 RepID=UPI0038D3A6E3